MRLILNIFPALASYYFVIQSEYQVRPPAAPALKIFRAAHLGIKDLDRKYDLHEIVTAEAIFCATGVTKGALLDGVRIGGGFVRTHSLVMHSASHTVREVRLQRPL